VLTASFEAESSGCSRTRRYAEPLPLSIQSLLSPVKSLSRASGHDFPEVVAGPVVDADTPRLRA